MKKLLLSVVASATLISCVNAATTTLTGFTAEATILKLAEATTISALNFGTIYTNDAGGNVTLTSDVKGGQGTIAFVNTAMRGLDDHQQGIIAIAGGPDGEATVAIAKPAIQLSHENSKTATPMQATLNIKGPKGDNTIDLSLAAGDIDNVYVGGTLTVGSKQEVGVYKGTYDIVVTY